MKNKNEKNIKKSNRLLLWGILILVIGIILLTIAINKYNAEYKSWHQDWFYNHTANLFDKPHFPFYGILGGLMCFGGFVTTISGIIVRFSESFNKLHTKALETLSNTNTQENIDTNTTSPSNTNTEYCICVYCGAKTKASASKCSCCGASEFKSNKN